MRGDQRWGACGYNCVIYRVWGIFYSTSPRLFSQLSQLSQLSALLLRAQRCTKKQYVVLLCASTVGLPVVGALYGCSGSFVLDRMPNAARMRRAFHAASSKTKLSSEVVDP